MGIKSLILIFILAIGCGSLTTNLVNEQEVSAYDVIVNGNLIKAELKFKRFSWFKEANMTYDLLFARLEKDSAFYHWYSTDEKETLEECAMVFVGIHYSMDAKYISHRRVINELESQGAEEIVALDFNQQLKLHPIYEREALQRYRVRTYCFKAPISELKMNLPMYRNIRIY